MRAFPVSILGSTVAVVVAIAALTATSMVLDGAMSAASAAATKARAQAQTSMQPVRRSPAARPNDFEHQQCSWENPCAPIANF